MLLLLDISTFLKLTKIKNNTNKIA